VIEKQCPPLVMILLGFLLGVIAAKLAERFCPLCRGESCCCDGGEGCCCDDGGSPCTCVEGEPEAAAEDQAEQ
jgi:hypothetical protein